MRMRLAARAPITLAVGARPVDADPSVVIVVGDDEAAALHAVAEELAHLGRATAVESGPIPRLGAETACLEFRLVRSEERHGRFRRSA
jgi:hypothetical protein